MARDSSGKVNCESAFIDFLSLLNELKATGCNLLVVGDARPELFARASANLFGDPEAVRYRLLAATDASPQSIAERLPDPDEAPRPLAETTRLVNHAVTPRSVASASGSDAIGLAGIPETRVADSELEGLQSALVDGIEEFARRTDGFRPGELRIGIDSLGILFDHSGEDVVRRCLQTVGGRVYDHNAMAHYLLNDDYDSERVQALVDDVDAVIELRSVNPVNHDHDAEQRWRVPNRNLATDWVRL
ncbi:DUF7504 family protein [Halorussus caseinilyticus]|uniref:Uncharacterized protein n=1 Tax=Halorussus caseinilyticus TaxID=3034025 RepID=A0ABD5WIW9_9EURY|nr:hypothetical protein [Halorussus sp. DT72]